MVELEREQVQGCDCPAKITLLSPFQELLLGSWDLIFSSTSLLKLSPTRVSELGLWWRDRYSKILGSLMGEGNLILVSKVSWRVSQNHRWDLSPEGRKMKHICLCVCGNSQLGASKPRRETCTLERVGSKVQNRGPPPLTLGTKELSIRPSRFPAISHTHPWPQLLPPALPISAH